MKKIDIDAITNPETIVIIGKKFNKEKEFEFFINLLDKKDIAGFYLIDTIKLWNLNKKYYNILINLILKRNNNLENLEVLCIRCHLEKHNGSISERSAEKVALGART